jgi:hypothetical protein
MNNENCPICREDDSNCPGHNPFGCPDCGKILDASQNMESMEAAKPSPGDISICCYCACLMQFQDDLTGKAVSLDELSVDDHTKLMIKKARQFWLEKLLNNRAQGNK